jgi:hypothetical protein
MATLIDIIGGIFVGGFLLLIALSATDTATTEFFNYNSDAIMQQNLAKTSKIIQYDLRKMGYGVPEELESTILNVATGNRLKFLAHLNSDPDARVNIAAVATIDHIVDTIEYVALPFDSVDYYDTTVTTYRLQRTLRISPNYRHTMTVGVIGNQQVFRYLDQIGNETAFIPGTRIVEVTLTAFDPRIFLSRDWVDSKLTDPSNAELRKKELRRLLRASYWRQTRLISRNLSR